MFRQDSLHAASGHAVKLRCSPVVMTDVSSRQFASKHSGADRKVVMGASRPVRRRVGRQEARPQAVVGARRPVRTSSWAPGGPYTGHLERQEARRQAVLAARKGVGRPSWAPGGPFRGRLGPQETRREAVLGAKRPVPRQSWQPGGAVCRFYCRFAAKCRFCAGCRGCSRSAKSPRRQA